MGKLLTEKDIVPDAIYCSTAIRAKETSMIVLENIPFKDEIKYDYSGNTIDFATNEFKESLNKIDIPLTLMYNIGHGNLTYYIRGGGGLSYITKVNSVLNFKSESFSQTSAKINFSDYRKSPLFFATIGSGTKIKIPRGFLVIDGRFFHFFE